MVYCRPTSDAQNRLTFRTAALVVQTAMCAVIVVAGMALPHEEVTSPVAVSWALTVALAWSVCSWWSLTGTLFEPYGMFMVSLFLFNGGQALLEIAGLNARGILGGKFDDEVLVATLYMVLLGFSFTHLGALLAVRRSRAANVAQSFADRRGLRAVGWLLLGVSVVPATFLLWTTARTIMAGGYMAAYQRETATGIAAGPQVVATFLIPAGLMLLAGAEGRWREKLAAAMVIGLYTLTQLFLGYRSTAIMPACAFLWLWNTCEKRIGKRWLLAGALFLIAVVIPISRETRAMAGPDRTTLTTFVESYASIENPVISSISEIGGSMGTVAHTYMLVPASRPFDRGIGYAFAALTLMPNLFGSIHPTIQHGTASDWLVQTVDPYLATQGGGLGYSCIAEAYLNFGWPGVALIMALIGFLISTLSGVATHSRRSLALVAIFMAFVLRFPRDESASLVRAFFWYSWAPYFLASVISLGNRRANMVVEVARSRVNHSQPALD